MWISNKKWKELKKQIAGLEKRVAALEIKGQQPKISSVAQMKQALKEALQDDAHQMQEFQHPPIVLGPLEPIALLIKKRN